MKEAFHSSVGQFDHSFDDTTYHDEVVVHGTGTDVFGDDAKHQVGLIRADVERHPSANPIFESDSIPNLDMATRCRLDDHRDRHLWNTLPTLSVGCRRYCSGSDPDRVPWDIRIVHQSGAHPVQAQPPRWYVQLDRVPSRTQWLIQYQSTIWGMLE